MLDFIKNCTIYTNKFKASSDSTSVDSDLSPFL